MDSAPHVDKADFRRLCRRVADRERLRSSGSVVVTWRQELAGIDPADLVPQVFDRSGRGFFWSSPRDGLRMVASGTALDAAGAGAQRFARVRHDIEGALAHVVNGGPAAGRSAVVPVVVGGFAFAPATDGRGGGTDGRGGQPFPDGLLWLPEVLLVRDGSGTTTLTLSTVVSADRDADEAAQRIGRSAEHLLATGSTLWRRSYPAAAGGSRAVPSEGRWKAQVAAAVQRIGAGELSKVVLARELRLQSARLVDVPAAVDRLLRAQPQATVFAVQLGEHAFLGATPEHLVRVADGHVESMSLAASAPRGATAQDDAALAATLLGDDKSRREQAIVTAAVRRALADLCTDITVPTGPEVLKLATVQHLRSTVSAVLADPVGTGVLDLVERLHPTPAVGGHPREPALRWIAANEPFDRGWYAGPVGWVGGGHDGEFAVAIRSAHVSGRTASLYAGCGIVAGSRPEDELAESTLKLRAMSAALGLDSADGEVLGATGTSR